MVDVLVVGLEAILNKFTDNTKLGGADDSIKGGKALQRDLGKLEGWAIIKNTKLNKNECQTLRLGIHTD